MRKILLNLKGSRGRAVFGAALFLFSVAGPGFAAPLQRLLGQRGLPDGENKERYQTGFVRFAHFFKNDESAVSARPNGTGTAYNLYQLYFNDAMQGQKTNFLADALFLSDRQRPNSFNVTELDYLLGLAMKGPNWNLQFNREEDLPIDAGGISYRYWDVRASSMGGFGEPKKKTGLGKLPMHMRGKGAQVQARWTIMIGYFLHNNSYPARPDGTGRARMRYHAKAEVLVPEQYWKLVGSADMLTDRRKTFKPVGITASYGVAVGGGGAEIAFLREYRENLDGPGFFPYYLMRMTYSFDTRRSR